MPAFESSIRVPLCIRLPGATASVSISKLVLNTDLAPSIMALTRVTPWLVPDGRSLVPLMRNPELATWRRIGLIEHSVGATPTGFGYPPSYLALRTETPSPLTFVRYPIVASGVDGELYDLTADTDQLDNQYTDPARALEIARLNLCAGLMHSCRAATCAYFENTY
jgi:arylsulfatase A-like enzyme